MGRSLDSDIISQLHFTKRVTNLVELEVFVVVVVVVVFVVFVVVVVLTRV